MKRHLIGIGGVGMSALATVLAKQGDEVTGADRNLDTPSVRFLRSSGIEVFPDDGSGVDGSVDEIIVSTAIERDNPGLERAAALGIPVVHRAVALAKALEGRKLVAVAGTCGKSTVAAMLGHILFKCGFDPLCVNGANVPGWDGAVRFGSGEYAVAEVDESDRSLVAFSPYAAIVTNASADHYSKEEMDAVFDAFAAKCKGPVVDGRTWHGDPEGLPVPMPGRHNRMNAAIAVEMAVRLGAERKKAVEALDAFGGVERRLQRYGSRVYDDYAHNPEKLRAMWSALVDDHPGGVCVIWRPHGYAPLKKNLASFADAFADSVRPADALLLLPVYDAGGTAERTVKSEDLAKKLEERAVAAICVAGHDEALSWVERNKNRYGRFAVCGARDPYLPGLARRISEILV